MTTGNFARTWVYVLASGLSLIFYSCAAQPKSREPDKTKIDLPSGTTLSQSGFAEQPAEVSESDSSASVDLPKGSTIEVFPASATLPGKISLKLSANSSLKLGMKTARAVTAKSFAPPKPPTATEIAKAEGIKIFYWLSAGLVLLALFLVWGQHYKAAGIAAGGAVVVPLVGNFVSEVSAVWVALIFVGMTATLFAAWYFVRGRAISPVEPAKSL